MSGQVYLSCVWVSCRTRATCSCGIRHGERENRDAVQRLTGRYDTACTDQAAAGLQTHNVTNPAGTDPSRPCRYPEQSSPATRHCYRRT